MQRIGHYIMDTTVPRISAKTVCRSHCGMPGFYRSCMTSNVYFGTLAAERGPRDEFLCGCPTIERTLQRGRQSHE